MAFDQRVLNHLPAPLSKFIGREPEIAAVTRHLADNRLVTLTGTGGIGKTRLALAAAARLTQRYPGGVFLIELAALSVPALVLQAIATALGIREASARPILDVLVDTLSDQCALLVFDNCEHLLDACAEACHVLLQACPFLTVLATSREPLGVPGEIVWRVPSLTVPEHADKRQAFGDFESVRLFVDRANAAHPGFVFSEHNAVTVGDICQRLDGIPLAIELAAAWVKILSVGDIAARLDDRFRLLTGGGRSVLPRQQTLRGTLDWSYGLLDAPQRILFRRLAIFEGGWTLEAAEDVVAQDPIGRQDVVELLTHLVDKSLVLVESDFEPVRYRMLETTRQYGLELIARFDETERLRQAHASYFAELAHVGHHQLLRPGQRAWIDRLDRERDNVRGAMRWAVEQRMSDIELSMAAHLWDYWWMRGHLTEGYAAVEDALERAPAVASMPRALATHGAGLLGAIRGDMDHARSRMREAAEMYEHLDQPVAAVRPLCDLASTMVFLGDEAEAERIGMRALEVARSASLSWGLGYALHMVGQLRLAQQRYTDVVDFADEAVPIWLKLGDARGLAHELLSKAIALRHLGDSREANRVAREALRHFNELGELWGQFGALLSLAASHAALGQVELAARLTGAAEAFSQTIGAVPIPVWQTEWDFARDTVCVSLGPRQSESNFAIGHATSIGQAIALAIASEPAEPRAALPDGVTAREAEVLQLLAQRYSNREIADALVLSIRTVERHISNIYLKTGISSRREAANYLKRGNDFFSE